LLHRVVDQGIAASSDRVSSGEYFKDA
jgi:hypothetical protein